MTFNIQPLQPLKRKRACTIEDNDGVEPTNTTHRPICRRKAPRTMAYDTISDSDSTATMEIDSEPCQTTCSTEETSSDYQMSMSTPPPSDTPLQKHYYGPGILAFPDSLEVFNVENTNWYWNATSWVQTRQLDAVECNQICAAFHTQHGWSPSPGSLPAIQLGTSEDMISRSTPRFSTFIVFPSAGSDDNLRSDTFLRTWTDQITVPALLHAARKREGFTYSVPTYARSYTSIKMASECQRIVSPTTSTPDTPVSIRLRSDELADFWSSMHSLIASSAQLADLPYLQDFFLVVVAGKDSETGMQCYGSNIMAFWKHFSARWDRAVNMQFASAEGAVVVSPKVYWDVAS